MICALTGLTKTYAGEGLGAELDGGTAGAGAGTYLSHRTSGRK